MSNYGPVERDLAAGVQPEVLCATCPWDRLCVSPPITSRVEIDRLMAQAEARDNEQRDKTSLPVNSLLTALALGGRDTSGQLCPVFAMRLSSYKGRHISDGIRRMMQAWE